MTVESWLKGRFQGISSQIERNVLESAALSPVFAKPRAFREVILDDNVRDYIGDQEKMNGLTYALSTLFYSMSAAITGGTRSERRGNRDMTIGGYPLTTADREAFRKEADRLRRELGCEPEENLTDSGGAFDASKLRAKSPSVRISSVRNPSNLSGR